jgi:hypothetical protein
MRAVVSTLAACSIAPPTPATPAALDRRRLRAIRAGFDVKAALVGLETGSWDARACHPADSGTPLPRGRLNGAWIPARFGA